MIALKTCTICNITKELEQFSVLNRAKDGRYPQCKGCKGKKDKEYYINNKDVILEKSNNKYEQTKHLRIPLTLEEKEVKKLYNSDYKDRKSEFIKDYNLSYRRDHSSEIKEQRKQFRLDNKDKINEYARNLRKTDPLYKVKKNLRNRVREVINNKGFVNDLGLEEYLGCTYEQLIIHIESQFKPGMTWENRSEWHIDHKLPISNGTTVKQVQELSNYHNLEPLWPLDNLTKNNKASICWQKLMRDKLINEDKKAGYNFDLLVKDFQFNEESLTNEHINFIKRYEWLGTIGYSPRYCFTARNEGKLAGVIIISEPIMFTKEFGNKEALIARGACSSWAPNGLNSSLVMFSCRWMIKHTHKRIFTAYSDPKAGEVGTIYQACNFDYLGDNFGAKRMYVLPGGKLVGRRYFSTLNSLKRWAKYLDITWEKSWIKSNGYPDLNAIPKDIYKQLYTYGENLRKSCKMIKPERKGKYVLALNYGHEPKIEKTWIKLPYPKGHNSHKNSNI